MDTLKYINIFQCFTYLRYMKIETQTTATTATTTKKAMTRPAELLRFPEDLLFLSLPGSDEGESEGPVVEVPTSAAAELESSAEVVEVAESLAAVVVEVAESLAPQTTPS